MSIVEKFNQSPVQRKFDVEFQEHAQALREIMFRTTFGCARRDAFWRLIHRAEECSLTTADVDRCARTAEALFAEAVRDSAEERSPVADEALAAATWYDEFARRLQPYVRNLPLCVYFDGKPGPHSSELISAWIAARVGGKCPRCSTTLEDSWGSIMPDCETCRNEWPSFTAIAAAEQGRVRSASPSGSTSARASQNASQNARRCAHSATQTIERGFRGPTVGVSPADHQWRHESA